MEDTLGKRIVTLRKRADMTQEQLAERLGVSPQAVSKWENDASCPDISILASLAEILGVTTDELLGAAPVKPHVIVTPTKSEPSGERNFTVNLGQSKSSIWFALMLILVGVAWFLSKTEMPLFNGITLWGIVWPAALLGTGIAWMIKRFSPFALGVAALGLYFLLFNLGAISFVLTWSHVWPILLILMGLSIITDRLIHKTKTTVFGDSPVSDNVSVEDGYVNSDISFGESSHAVNSDILRGGNIDNSFGKSSLDFTACRSVEPGAVINVDLSFGDHEILLPRCIRANINVSKSFAAVSVKGEPDADAQTVVISGDVSFGNLTLRYI